MSKNLTITLTDQFFVNADELENTLLKIGERVTSGQYKAGHNNITDNNGRKLGECRVSENPMTLIQPMNAGHGVNGNRREIWVQYSINGDIIAVYKYNNKMPSALRVSACVSLPTVNVSFKELQEWIKDAKQSSQYYEGE